MKQPTLDRRPVGAELEGIHVGDAMHRGVVTCPAETPLRDVARMMAAHRIHSIVTFGAGADDGAPGVWGVVSDLDLVRAARAREFDRWVAGEIAATPVVLVQPDDELAKAVQLMDEHDVTHLVVNDRRSGRPIGILSTLDIARVLGGPPAKIQVSDAKRARSREFAPDL